MDDINVDFLCQRCKEKRGKITTEFRGVSGPFQWFPHPPLQNYWWEEAALCEECHHDSTYGEPWAQPYRVAAETFHQLGVNISKEQAMVELAAWEFSYPMHYDLRENSKGILQQRDFVWAYNREMEKRAMELMDEDDVESILAAEFPLSNSYERLLHINSAKKMLKRRRNG